MMIAQPKTDLVTSLQKFSLFAAAGAVAVGFLVLIGWWANLAAFRNLWPGLAAMMPNTAVSFVLSGVSLWLVRRSPAGGPALWLRRACPIAVAGIALLTLTEYAFSWDLRIDRLLLPGNLSALSTSISGRMHPMTALNFLLLGIALPLLNTQRARRYVYAQSCACVAWLLSLLVLTEYAYSLPSPFSVASSTSFTPYTSVEFLLLSLGILFAQPDRGLMAVMTDRGHGGKLLRRSLPITVAIPFILGWLRLVGQKAGFFGTAFGLALFVTSTICIFALLTWGYARSLVVSDAKRAHAEDLANGQKRVFEMISKGVSLQDTLSALIRVLEEQGRGMKCSILLLDRDGVHLHHGSAPSLPLEYTSAIDGAAIGPKAGSCGTAAFCKEPILVQDIATDPLWADYKHLALPHGLNACWSTPIFDDNHRVLGTFAIYDSKPIVPSPEFLNLIDLATYTASIGIRSHNAAQSLLESVVHLSLVYNSVVDVIFHVRVEPDGQFRFESVNHAFYKATGLAEGQVIGKLVREVVPEPSRSLILEKYQEAIRTRQTVRWEEVTKYPSETKFGDVTVTPVFDSDGHCTSLIGSVHDMTEQKKLELQFRQAQKMEAVGQLAGGVAHDFNNLLTVINGYSEMMLRDLNPEEPKHGYAEEIKNAGERAASLTRQLLAFSRRQVMSPQVLDLNTIIANMDKMLQRLIGEDINLIAVPAKDLGRVKADPGQVEQIILNLVVNARDAMPQGGKLTIETANVELDATFAATHVTAKPGPHVMLAVTDTGTGMDAETQKRIFEPFFTTKEAGKGTGLGLSTVYGIVKQSEGHIWVYSELGHGTSFKVYLPRVEMPVDLVGPSKAKDQMRGGTETILLVEDEPSVRALVRKMLDANGYQVLETTNSSEGLHVAEQHRGKIHLLLTDLVMPGTSGRVLAKQLLGLKPELKVLYMSGYTDDAVIRHGGLEAGMAFIQKPFTPDALAGKLREVLDAGQSV